MAAHAGEGVANEAQRKKNLQITISNMLTTSHFSRFIPLSPGLKMHILLAVLHTFLLELVRRICVIIKTSYPW